MQCVRVSTRVWQCAGLLSQHPLHLLPSPIPPTLPHDLPPARNSATAPQTDVGAALVALVAPNRIPMPVLDMATRCHAPSPLTLPEAQCKVVAGDGPAEGRMGKADDLRSVLHDIMTVVSRCSGGLVRSRNRRCPSRGVRRVLPGVRTARWVSQTLHTLCDCGWVQAHIPQLTASDARKRLTQAIVRSAVLASEVL